MAVGTGYSVGNLNDLRAVAPDRRATMALRFVYETRKWYVFNGTSTAADDNDSTIAPISGSGRWEAIGAGGAGGELSDQVAEMYEVLFLGSIGNEGPIPPLVERSAADNARIDTLENTVENFASRIQDLEAQVLGGETSDFQILTGLTRIMFGYFDGGTYVQGLVDRVAALENP